MGTARSKSVLKALRMMRLHGWLCVAVVSAMSSGVRADIEIVFPSSGASWDSSALRPLGETERVHPWIGDRYTQVFPHQDSCGSVVLGGLSDEPISSSRNLVVRQPPPEPSGASLVLLGLSTLGVFGVGRSARKVHFSGVTEWLATNGPGQVGHAAAVGPDLDFSDLPLCHIEKAIAKPTAIPRVSWDLVSRFRSQSSVRIRPSRAPPISL